LLPNVIRHVSRNPLQLSLELSRMGLGNFPDRKITAYIDEAPDGDTAIRARKALRSLLFEALSYRGDAQGR
jgi:hypothetical protein